MRAQLTQPPPPLLLIALLIALSVLVMLALADNLQLHA